MLDSEPGEVHKEREDGADEGILIGKREEVSVVVKGRNGLTTSLPGVTLSQTNPPPPAALPWVAGVCAFPPRLVA